MTTTHNGRLHAARKPRTHKGAKQPHGGGHPTAGQPRSGGKPPAKGKKAARNAAFADRNRTTTKSRATKDHTTKDHTISNRKAPTAGRAATASTHRTAGKAPTASRTHAATTGRTAAPTKAHPANKVPAAGKAANARNRHSAAKGARHKPAAGSKPSTTSTPFTATNAPAARQSTGGHVRAATTHTGGDPASTVGSFDELGLPRQLSAALTRAGIHEPFPIQAATLPDALAGRDVLGKAQTGSGKTLAFGLALLSRLDGGRARPKHPRALVLVPTRELAMQVSDALTPLAKALGLWCRTVVGGMSFTRQADALRRGVDLLIATPGRLSDHVRQGTCVLDEVELTTLDEADQMADMGFLPQVRAILDLTPEGQRLLFSATLDGDVAALVRRYLTDPVSHEVQTAGVSTMDHHILLVSKEDKPQVIAELAAKNARTIMFLRTKHHVDRLTRKLQSLGVHAGALHGGKTQGARNRVLGDFKQGSLPVLIATDVAARGIHVDGVSLVVHVDPPADAKGYLHRAGRTARAGESGTVVTLATHQERRTVFRMTEQAGVRPTSTTVRPGDEALRY